MIEYWLYENLGEKTIFKVEHDFAIATHVIDEKGNLIKNNFGRNYYFSWSISAKGDRSKKMTEEEVHRYLFAELL